MGRVARWLRTLLARKKPGVGEPWAEQQEKRRWGFGKSLSEKEQKRAVAGMSAASLAVSKEPNESYREVPRPYGPATLVVDEEQNKRAIAVAAATTAVAEAAVAAVKAVAVVVRLTNSGQALGLAGGQRDELAAIKIQSGFRGYLARRALKALRGLVKLQALVRGNIVRKQAAETLRCMQAMVRVQARARSCRALRTQKSRSELCPRMQFDALTSGKYEQAVQASAAVSDMSCTLKGEIEAVDCNRANASALNWWMQGAIEAVQKSGSFTSIDDDKNAKILEVDPGKPQSNHKKSNHYQYPFSPNLAPDYNSRGDSTIQQSTPTAASVDMQQYLSSMRFPMEAIYYCQSSQFDSASSRHANARKGLLTPSKSEYSMSLFSEFADYPNYMSNTESSKAKLRSQSAPKRRPELETFGLTKKPSVQGHGQKPTGALAHRSSSLHAQFANKAYPGAGRLDRLGLPLRI